MKIALQTLGSRGDVQPFVALGKALQARGHDVLLAAPNDFEDWVGRHGLAFHPMGVDVRAMMQSPDVQGILAGSWLGIFRIWRRTVLPMVRDMLDATWESGREADVIVYHPKIVGAVDVAEATGAAPVCASTIPLFATGEFPAILWTRDYGPWLNRLTYAAFNLARAPYVSILNRWRKEAMGLGKGPMFKPLGWGGEDTVTRLCMVSPTVVPRPADWDERAHMTGYWFLDEGQDWQPDPALAAFLEAGAPPVYIGFGSLTVRDPDRLARAVVDGVRRAGVRALLATGWGGLDRIEVPDTVHVIESAPHDALFQHVSAVVHHGGAGSTAAGLRAGRPTLVCPMGLDQPFWGNRVWKLGCGPKPQSLRRLNADRFAQGLKDLVDREDYRSRASSVAAAIAREDGVGRTIEIIEAGRSQMPAARKFG